MWKKCAKQHSKNSTHTTDVVAVVAIMDVATAATQAVATTVAAVAVANLPSSSLWDRCPRGGHPWDMGQWDRFHDTK